MKFLFKTFCSILVLVQVTYTQPNSQSAGFGFWDMFRIQKLSTPRLSPDGQFVVFENSTADTVQNIWIKQLWRTKVTTGETIQITRGDKSAHFPRWSYDGQYIYFLSNRTNQQNIYRIRNDGGEAEMVFHHPSNILSFAVTRDGQRIYFLAKDTLSREDKKKEKEKNQAYFYDENQKANHLWQYDMTTRAEKQLGSDNYSIREFRLSPSETKISFIAAPSPSVNDYLKREIYVLDLKTMKESKVTKNHIGEKELSWSPDERYISFTSDSNSRLETYYQETIFLLDVATETVLNLLPDFQYQVFDYFWTARGRYIYFIANTGVNTQIFYLNRINGGVRQLTFDTHEVRSLHYTPKVNKMVYLESNPERPYEVFYSEPAKQPGQMLTQMNSWLKKYAKARYRTIQWTSPDGHTSEGILILPGNKFNKPYPLIVQLHGGPESSYRNAFGSSISTYPQIWAARGYAVFQPNYRGSTGYGDQVMRSIIGHYFEKDIDDIISGTDYLIKQGLADPSKMAVMGWSAGGHLTNWIVTHFQRFKAACSGAGGANWSSFYAQTDVQYIREIWHLGPPYTRSEYYQEKSPVNYVSGAKTPTLILCGEKDKRVPFGQSLEMYRGLKRMGCPVKFVAFPGEPHGLKKIRHQLHKMRLEFQWIEQHLFGRMWELEDLN